MLHAVNNLVGSICATPKDFERIREEYCRQFRRNKWLIAGRIGAEERERRRVVRCVVLAVVCVMEVVLVVWKMNKIQEQATHLTTTPAQLCKAQQAGLLRVVCVCADGVI